MTKILPFSQAFQEQKSGKLIVELSQKEGSRLAETLQPLLGKISPFTSKLGLPSLRLSKPIQETTRFIANESGELLSVATKSGTPYKLELSLILFIRRIR